MNVKALIDAVDDLQRGDVDVPALHKDLQKASEAFESNKIKSDAEKVRLSSLSLSSSTTKSSVLAYEVMTFSPRRP